MNKQGIHVKSLLLASLYLYIRYIKNVKWFYGKLKE